MLKLNKLTHKLKRKLTMSPCKLTNLADVTNSIRVLTYSIHKRYIKKVRSMLTDLQTHHLYFDRHFFLIFLLYF